MFGKRITLFTVLGIRIGIDMSWAFLALLVAWSLAQGFFPAVYEGLPVLAYWWMGLAGVLGLFISLIIHELMHSLVARAFGTPVRGITLFALGGVAAGDAGDDGVFELGEAGVFPAGNADAFDAVPVGMFAEVGFVEDEERILFPI